MQTRQKIGIFLMLMFMPINGEMCIRDSSELGYEVPLGEFQGFALTLVLFVIGAGLLIGPQIQRATK